MWQEWLWDIPHSHANSPLHEPDAATQERLSWIHTIALEAYRDIGLLPLHNPATDAVSDGTNASEADNTQGAMDTTVVPRAVASQPCAVRSSPRPMQMFMEELEQYGTITDASIGTMSLQRENAQTKQDTTTMKKTLPTKTALQKESSKSRDSPFNKHEQTQEERNELGRSCDETHASSYIVPLGDAQSDQGVLVASTATPTATSNALDRTAYQQTPNSSSQRKSQRAGPSPRGATEDNNQSRQRPDVVVSPPEKNTDMTQLRAAPYSSSVVAPSQSQSRSKTYNVVTLQPTTRRPLLDHERKGMARLQEEDFEMDDLDTL